MGTDVDVDIGMKDMEEVHAGRTRMRPPRNYSVIMYTRNRVRPPRTRGCHSSMQTTV